MVVHLNTQHFNHTYLATLKIELNHEQDQYVNKLVICSFYFIYVELRKCIWFYIGKYYILGCTQVISDFL